MQRAEIVLDCAALGTPVGGALLLAPADDGDDVVDHGRLQVLLEDALAVGVQGLGGADAARDGAPRQDLSLQDTLDISTV